MESSFFCPVGENMGASTQTIPMASIKQTPTGTFRAYIEKLGVRKCKTFSSRILAERWADSYERRIVAQKTIADAAASTVLATMIPKRTLDALAKIPHQLDEILDATVPATTFTGIYFLVLNREIVYIGQSVDILHRISRHRREGREFDSYSYLLCDQSKLDELEEKYIVALMPWQNKTFGGAI